MPLDHLTIAVELIRRVDASNPDVVVLCMNYQSIRAEAEVIDIEQLCLKCALIKNIDAFTGTEPNVAIVVDCDVIDEVTVYCILHDEYLNTVGNVNVDVYIDDELTTSVLSDSNGVCRFNVDQPCTVKFVYGELESNSVVISGGE